MYQMKTFGELNIGDIIFKCNFKRCLVQKYSVINIDDSSQYGEQVKLYLCELDNSLYSYGYVTDETLAYADRSWERVRLMIDYDNDSIWCADKRVALEKLNEYNINELNKINELKNKILGL